MNTTQTLGLLAAACLLTIAPTASAGPIEDTLNTALVELGKGGCDKPSTEIETRYCGARSAVLVLGQHADTVIEPHEAAVEKALKCLEDFDPQDCPKQSV